MTHFHLANAFDWLLFICFVNSLVNQIRCGFNSFCNYVLLCIINHWRLTDIYRRWNEQKRRNKVAVIDLGYVADDSHRCAHHRFVTDAQHNVQRNMRSKNTWHIKSMNPSNLRFSTIRRSAQCARAHILRTWSISSERPVIEFKLTILWFIEN